MYKEQRAIYLSTRFGGGACRASVLGVLVLIFLLILFLFLRSRQGLLLGGFQGLLLLHCGVAHLHDLQAAGVLLLDGRRQQRVEVVWTVLVAPADVYVLKLPGGAVRYWEVLPPRPRPTGP